MVTNGCRKKKHRDFQKKKSTKQIEHKTRNRNRLTESIMKYSQPYEQTDIFLLTSRLIARHFHLELFDACSVKSSVFLLLVFQRLVFSFSWTKGRYTSVAFQSMSLTKYLYSANWRRIEAKRLYTAIIGTGTECEREGGERERKKSCMITPKIFFNKTHICCANQHSNGFFHISRVILWDLHIVRQWAQPIIIFALGELCFVALEFMRLAILGSFNNLGRHKYWIQLKWASFFLLFQEYYTMHAPTATATNKVL